MSKLTIHKSIRELSNKMFRIYSEDGFTPEYNILARKRKEIFDAIDPDLVDSFKVALNWIKNNHSRVYWNSSWTNSYSVENLIRDYHGINIYSSRHPEDEELVLTYISPKQIILRGFEFYKHLMDKERDILSAGGISTDHLGVDMKDVVDMLKDLESFTESLELIDW